ncbi:tripartite tricarboxylate transporter substrate binding protein [Desulfovibrio aminophilus]|nr:tripartite tricarboxylate transporter substrate binding protein [Desulfovibrio aminophilus]MCM0754777.1 tripartite tricarboxylate transporter substrate binding protein [Desulfovibrio aminophilus]
MKLRLGRMFLLFALMLGLCAGPAFAGSYPEKPINMIIAFTAGGSSDVQARIMQKYWNKLGTESWIFVYKAGAGGAIGFGEIAHADADGYTIGGVNVPHIVLQPLAQGAQYKISDFAYICQVVNDPQVVAVRKDSPYKSVKEVFDAAKAAPGKVKLGLVGPFSGHHLMMLGVKSNFKLDFAEVMYKGAADQNAALLGGEVDVIFGNVNDVMRSLDRLTILGVAAEKRNAFLPDVPTLKEQGYDVVSDIRRAFVAPKGIAPEKLKFLRDAFKKIATDPDYLADMKKAGQPAEYMDGAEFEAYVQKKAEEDRALLESYGLLKK